MTDFEKRVKSRFPKVEVKSVVQFSKMVGVSDTAMRNIFKKEMIGESFVINNPKASSSCGCGLSFSV